MTEAKVTTSDSAQLREENAIGAPVKNFTWDAQQAQAESSTHLEDDMGSGEVAVIRSFTFAANPEAWRIHRPTKQELFNHHVKQIEVLLWQDGLKLNTDSNPSVKFNTKKTKYTIFVAANPARGQILGWEHKPQTLTQIAHATPSK